MPHMPFWVEWKGIGVFYLELTQRVGFLKLENVDLVSKLQLLYMSYFCIIPLWTKVELSSMSDHAPYAFFG